METGRLVHEPTPTELGGLKVRNTLIGLVLLVAAALGLYVGAKGMGAGAQSGGGAALVTILTFGASVAIGFFGLRYLMLGLKGRGVRLYERAVEADFFPGKSVVPRRRTVPLMRVHVSGSARLAYAQAITTSGHAFRLPPDLVERSDLWFLGSLGTKPLAPGGREAKERYERGELERYRREEPPARSDHGPAWMDAPQLPIEVEVPIDEVVEQPEEVVEPVAVPPPSPPTVTPPPVLGPTGVTAPTPREVTPAPVIPSPPAPRMASRDAVDMLPDEPRPPPDIPPPPPEPRPPRAGPRIAPPAPPTPPPEPPAPVPEPPAPAPEPGSSWEGDWELEEVAPPEAPPTPISTPPPTPPPAEEVEVTQVEDQGGFEMEEVPPPTPPPAGEVEATQVEDQGGFELEEVPPPSRDEERPRTGAAKGGEWEEL